MGSFDAAFITSVSSDLVYVERWCSNGGCLCSTHSLWITHSIWKTFGEQKCNCGSDLPQRAAELRLLCVPSVSSTALTSASPRILSARWSSAMRLRFSLRCSGHERCSRSVRAVLRCECRNKAEASVARGACGLQHPALITAKLAGSSVWH